MKYKRKSIGKLLVVISGMGLAIALAWQMPRFIFSVYDKNTLQKKEEIQMEFHSFKKEKTLEERLYNLALKNSDPVRYQLSCVLMQEETGRISDEELTQIVLGELNSMKESSILSAYPEIQPQELASRKLYMAYMTDYEEKISQGSIAFWKLSYERQDGDDWYSLELVLDMEYHKLYAVRLFDAELTKEQSSRKQYKKVLKEFDIENKWVFIERLMNYYKLRENTMYKVKLTCGIDSNEQSDAYGTDAEIYAVKKEEENVLVHVIGQVSGYFMFYTEEETGEFKEAGIRLPFVRENGIKDEKGYVYIGISQLNEILQI